MCLRLETQGSFNVNLSGFDFAGGDVATVDLNDVWCLCVRLRTIDERTYDIVAARKRKDDDRELPAPFD